MSVRIRLTRLGTHKKPYYRVVAADVRAPRDGAFLDMLGTYNPLTNPAKIDLDEPKLIEWLKKGATTSETVKQIIKKSGLLARMNEEAKAS